MKSALILLLLAAIIPQTGLANSLTACGFETSRPLSPGFHQLGQSEHSLVLDTVRAFFFTMKTPSGAPLSFNVYGGFDHEAKIKGYAEARALTKVADGDYVMEHRPSKSYGAVKIRFGTASPAENGHRDQFIEFIGENLWQFNNPGLPVLNSAQPMNGMVVDHSDGSLSPEFDNKNFRNRYQPQGFWVGAKTPDLGSRGPSFLQVVSAYKERGSSAFFSNRYTFQMSLTGQIEKVFVEMMNSRTEARTVNGSAEPQDVSVERMYSIEFTPEAN
ncbi:MAG: hypothetical protein AAF202_03625 [Pseudomonadota bacterium]